MTISHRITSRDLEVMPLENGKRYEIIDGDLYVSTQPHLFHQDVCDNIVSVLNRWSLPVGVGRAHSAPGVIFAEDNDIAPDAVWVSTALLAVILGEDGHLHGPPELVIEVLSPGAANERRDRGIKLKLYSRQGVDEYWIVDRSQRTMEVYRRTGGNLELVERVEGDTNIRSPLLPGFAATLDEIFAGIPFTVYAQADPEP